MTAGERYFLDTNVLVYTFDDAASAKRIAARRLVCRALEEGRGVISFQVVQEFCDVATRKFARPLEPADLERYLRTVLAPLCDVHSSIALYDKALHIHEQTHFSFYDALIVAAAIASGCRALYTEDLQHGREIEGLRIIDPFAGESGRPIAEHLAE